MGNPNFAWIVFGIMLFVALLPVLLFARFARLWVQCLLSGAQVSITHLIMMRLRKCDVKKLCELYIMSTQAGLPIRLVELEQAYLAGVDVELVVRAMIKASQTGQQLSWEDAVSQAKKDQYDDYVEENYGDGA